MSSPRHQIRRKTATSTTDPNTQTILSVLKTYPLREVAIVGCHAARISRKSCEYDLLVVGKEDDGRQVPPKIVRMGELYAEILYTDEGSVRDPDPEFAVSLAHAVPLRDNSLLLAGAVATCKRNYKVNCSRAAEAHLAAALKALGRVDELVGRDEDQEREADLWLVTAAIEFCRSTVLSSLSVPSPSHMFAQMKSLSKKKSSSFKEWAEASGLPLASRTSCENRLDALGVLYDILKTSEVDRGMAIRLGRYRMDDAMAVVRSKAREMLDAMEAVECFSFLGVESVQTLADIYALHCHRLRREPDYSRSLAELTKGKDRLISEEVLRGLAIVRRAEMVRAGAESLRVGVSSLAGRI